MKLTEHAKDQLNDRYLQWGLDIFNTLTFIESLDFEEDEKYMLIIIDNIPIVLICDFNEIITVYPHPVDAAENWMELMETVKHQKNHISNLKKALNCANYNIDEKQKHIKKIEKQNKHWKQKMKGVWN